jgi:hypothetical protein
MGMLRLVINRDRGLWRNDLSRHTAAVRAGCKQEILMFRHQQRPPTTTPIEAPSVPPTPLLTITGTTARIESKFEIADSIEIECEVGGELRVGGKLIRRVSSTLTWKR